MSDTDVSSFPKRGDPRLDDEPEYKLPVKLAGPIKELFRISVMRRGITPGLLSSASFVYDDHRYDSNLFLSDGEDPSLFLEFGRASVASGEDAEEGTFTSDKIPVCIDNSVVVFDLSQLRSTYCSVFARVVDSALSGVLGTYSGAGDVDTATFRVVFDRCEGRDDDIRDFTDLGFLGDSGCLEKTATVEDADMVSVDGLMARGYMEGDLVVDYRDAGRAIALSRKFTNLVFEDAQLQSFLRIFLGESSFDLFPDFLIYYRMHTDAPEAFKLDKKSFLFWLYHGDKLKIGLYRARDMVAGWIGRR
jgi:hypothetical protein